MATIADINSHGKYALNPRGNLWLNDKDKLGEKLMKKMGWNEGKGLGKSENGIKENIKVKLKNNNSEPSLNSEATVKCLNSDTSDCKQSAECLSESHAITSGKKRKKSKAVMLTDQNEGITQCSSFATNGLDTPETNCETEEPKKKKKRKKSDIIEEADINDSDHLKICSSDSSPVKKSKRRKKSKTEIIEEEDSENQMCNGSNNLSEQETLHNSDTMLQNKKRKKTTDLYSKAKKLKTNTISKLKSCLKHNLLKPSLKKQVSFCKDISFRTFASESAIDSMDEEQVADINAPELEVDPSHENTTDEKDTEIDKKIERTLNVSESVETNAETKSKTELEACISETVSPVKRTSVYNSWLDSHRQALKMKMYKGMYKNIKEHYIFQSTNLTQIKGYGNWGY